MITLSYVTPTKPTMGGLNKWVGVVGDGILGRMNYKVVSLCQIPKCLEFQDRNSDV